MKAVLNLLSVAALGALGAGIYVLQGQADGSPSADGVPEPVIEESADVALEDPVADNPAEPETAADTVAPRYTVDGTLPGYFVANEDVRFGDYVLTSIMVEPDWNGFEERVLLSIEDTSEVAGSNEYGDYYQAYPLQVDDWSVTPEGVSITAHHAELGEFSLSAVYDPAGYAAWTSGESAVGDLLIADITLDGVTRDGVSLAFWVGD
jgi:hypothetical protein